MNGVLNSPFKYDVREPLLNGSNTVNNHNYNLRHNPGNTANEDGSRPSSSLLVVANNGSANGSLGTGTNPYVPPGYIMLDNTNSNTSSKLLSAIENDYVPSSVWLKFKSQPKKLEILFIYIKIHSETLFNVKIVKCANKVVKIDYNSS